jgi:hypothetical protein
LNGIALITPNKVSGIKQDIRDDLESLHRFVGVEVAPKKQTR